MAIIKEGGNTNLTAAKVAKDDEFYTPISDIEDEVKHYRSQLKGKVVYLNCDNPKESNFFKFFALQYNFLGLKGLIATHYDANKPSYRLDFDGTDINGDGKIDWDDAKITPLKGNGDFRSEECLDILHDGVDVVITNPPFSIQTEYMQTLVDSGKKFLVLGSKILIAKQACFKHIMEGKYQPGYAAGTNMTFNRPDGSTKTVGIAWWTNLETCKREPLTSEGRDTFTTHKEWKDGVFDARPDIINVNKVKDIPLNYGGIMGVPVTFIHKINTKQFEILGMFGSKKQTDINICGSFVDGKAKFQRLAVRNRKPMK